MNCQLLIDLSLTDECSYDVTIHSKNEPKVSDTSDVTIYNFSTTPTSPECTLVEFIHTEPSSVSVYAEKKVIGKPCKSAGNLFYDPLKQFSINANRFSRSMDAISCKPRYANYYYKKMLLPWGSKET